MYILTVDCLFSLRGDRYGLLYFQRHKDVSSVDLARRCLVGLELRDMVERLLAKITACCIREGMLVYGKRSLVRGGGVLIFGCIYVFYWAKMFPLNKVQTFYKWFLGCPSFLVFVPKDGACCPARRSNCCFFLY